MVNRKVNNGQYGKRKSVSEGVSSLIDKNGFLQSKSTKSAEVLNDQFVSAYTHEDTESIPHKGPSPYRSMQKIKVNPSGVAKRLRDLKQHKASGGQYPDIHT